MRTNKSGRKPLTWPVLETVIVIGLTCKLIISVAFLLFLHGGMPGPLQAPLAYAQDDQKPSETSTVSPTQAPPPAASPESSTKQFIVDDREKTLDQREERLKEREKALAALESDLNARMAEIEETRKKLAELVKKQEALVEEQRVLKDARIEHLVTAYKGMRPERAGSLVNSLDDDVAVLILSAMPGRNAGQILAYVDPTKAARLTKAISERKQPVPEESADTSTPKDTGTPPPQPADQQQKQ